MVISWSYCTHGHVAALDLNLGGPPLQPPGGLLLNVAGLPTAGQKRQRTDDDADPAGKGGCSLLFVFT